MKAVILCNGDFPRHDVPLQALSCADCVICCDGAANEFVERGGNPQYIVGDGDSLNAELQVRFADRFVKENEQETNDLTKAFRLALRLGYSDIDIVGATGKREDHTLGNIAHLTDFSKRASVRMLTDYGTFIPCTGSKVIPAYVGQQVSVFNINARGLNSEGLKWQLSDFRKGWEGTLNEATQTTVNINGEGDYLVYLAY